MTWYIVTLDAWAAVEADTPEAAKEAARSVRAWDDYEVTAVCDVTPETDAEAVTHD